MNVMGIGSDLQYNVFNALAGLLHLGNCKFGPSAEGEGSALDEETGDEMTAACELLGFDRDGTVAALTSKKLYIGSEVTTTVLNPAMVRSAEECVAVTVIHRSRPHPPFLSLF